MVAGDWQDPAGTRFALSFLEAPADSPPPRSNWWEVWGLPLLNNGFGVYPVVTSDQKWARVDRHRHRVASIFPDLPHFQVKLSPLIYVLLDF